jgi:hypothetical protein
LEKFQEHVQRSRKDRGKRTQRQKAHERNSQDKNAVPIPTKKEGGNKSKGYKAHSCQTDKPTWPFRRVVTLDPDEGEEDGEFAHEGNFAGTMEPVSSLWTQISPVLACFLFLTTIMGAITLGMPHISLALLGVLAGVAALYFGPAFPPLPSAQHQLRPPTCMQALIFVLALLQLFFRDSSH